MSATATQITRKALLTLFGELKINAPNDNWENARLLMKAKKLPEYIGTAKPELTKESQETLDTVLAALEAKTAIELDGDNKKKGENDMKATKESKKKGKKAAGNGRAKNTAGAASSAEKDKYGCRVGTFIASVNAAMSKSFQTIEEIMTKAGIKDKGKYKQNHLNAMVEKKHFKKDKEGRYAIA